MTEFINVFKDLLEDTDPATITELTEFKSLEEWSSIMALSLIATVDDNYEVTIGTEEIRSAKTLKDLFDIIQSKK